MEVRKTFRLLTRRREDGNHFVRRESSFPKIRGELLIGANALGLFSAIRLLHILPAGAPSLNLFTFEVCGLVFPWVLCLLVPGVTDIEWKRLIGAMPTRDELKWFLKIFMIVWTLTVFLHAGFVTLFPSVAAYPFPHEYQTSSWISLLLILTKVAFLTPISEEVLVRGLMLNAFARKWGFTVGASISSIFFMLGHTPAYDFFPNYFFAGLAACVVYARYGKIIFPIALHAANNFVVIENSASSQPIVGVYRQARHIVWHLFSIPYFGPALAIASFAAAIRFLWCLWPEDPYTVPYDVGAPANESAVIDAE